MEQALKSQGPPDSEHGTMDAAGSVSIAIMISRVLGLIRDIVQATYFGAGLHTDALTVANRVPNLLRDLFAEGALSSAFVPTFIRTLTRDGKERAWVLANRVISALLVIMAGVTLLFFLGAKGFVYLFAAGYADIPQKFDLTVQMTRILSPFLLFLALASVFMGILNACGSYFIPAMASSAFNVCCISGGVLLSPLMPRFGIQPVVSMAIGALVGGASQFLVMLPSAHRYGFRYRFDLNLSDPGLRHIARLMLPAVVGLSATQINVLVDSQLASRFGNGPVSWLSYGFRIMQFPIGVFGIAVATASITAVSRYVASNQLGRVAGTLSSSLRFTACLTFPATIGMVLYREEIVRLLFQGGSFTPADTIKTSQVVMLYALALFSYSAVKILVPTFYALDKTKIPVQTSMITVAAKIALNFVLILPFGFLGLALATATASWINFGLLLHRVRRIIDWHLNLKEISVYIRIAAASGSMGALSLIVFRGTWIICSGPDLMGQAFRLLLAIAAGIGSFFPLLRLFKVDEGRQVLQLAAAMMAKLK